MATQTSLGGDKLRHIEAYAAAGFRLTPLRTTGRNKGKAPVAENWTEIPHTPKPNPKDFDSCNYGVILDDTHLVIDLDPRNYAAGVSSWEELAKATGLTATDLHKTLVVRTGGGGSHIYFKKPADWHIKGKLKEFPGVDFLSKGRHVVGPGSIHPDTGKPYELLAGDPSQLADAPETLLNLIKQANLAPSQDIQVFDATKTDTPQATERFIEYLDNLTPVPAGSRNKSCFIMAVRAREYGVGETNAFHIITQRAKFETPLADDEIRRTVRSAFERAKTKANVDNAQAVFKKLPKVIQAKKWPWDGKVEPKTGLFIARPTQNNLRGYMSVDELGLAGLLSYNELTYGVETTRPVPWPPYKAKEWEDADTDNLKVYLSMAKRIEYSQREIEVGVSTMARYQSFHPVRNWLDGLIWDGKPRLDTWLHRILGVEDNPYTRAVASITLMGAVARAYEPGCKFDYMLVLEGEQGIKKSQTVECLAGFNPQLYCSAAIRLDSASAEKDTIAYMSTALFVEVAELVMQTQEEIDQMKAFVTRRVDKVRLPFMKRPQQIPRQCIFIGTTNPENGAGYLRDRTGARRFWPVKCTKDADLITLELERDQLFAEAKARWKAGALLYMPPDVEALAKIQQKDRELVDPWQDLLEGQVTADRIWTTEEIYRGLLKCDPKFLGPKEQRRISGCMRNLGFEYGYYFHAPTGARRRGFKHKSYAEATERDKVLEDSDEKTLDNFKV